MITSTINTEFESRFKTSFKKLKNISNIFNFTRSFFKVELLNIEILLDSFHFHQEVSYL